MKIYARQIRPDYQESPLEWEGIPSDLIIPGNRTHRSHNTDHCAYRQIMQYFDDMADAWNEDGVEAYIPTDNPMRYNVIHKPHSLSVAEILHDYGFEPEPADAWTQDQLDAWRDLMESDDTTTDERLCCIALGLITGGEWDCISLTGSTQGDYVNLFYPMNAYDHKAIRDFEIKYFNLGTAWVVQEDGEAPEDPEDIGGYFYYSCATDEESIKQEIASIAGAQPEDVTLYCWTGLPVAYKYRIA